MSIVERYDYMGDLNTLFFEGQCKREQSQACLNSAECSLNSIFYQLLRVAIGSKETLSCSPSKAEWRVLYDMAKKQSLVGICFAGLQKLYYFDNQEPSTHNPQPDSIHNRIQSTTGFNPEPQTQNHTQEITHNQEPITHNLDEVHYLTWMGMTAQINMRNDAVNEQCVELQKRLLANGFRSCVLKGQGVATLYGEELRGFRQSGDIDIWIDASKEKVIDYVMKLAPTKEFDQKHIHLHCFKETEVECHWIPVKRTNPFHNKLLENYFNSERERQFSNVVDGFCIPTCDFQLVHQLLHVYSHYMYEGVGLRQMMDLYFALRASYESQKTNEYYQKVTTLFKELRLLRFVAATQWVLMEVFKLPKEQCLCEPNEKEGKKLLREIMIGGNFGHYDKRNQIADESSAHRFFRRWGRRFRMFGFDPLGTIVMPFSRLKLEAWMRRVRRKYEV